MCLLNTQAGLRLEFERTPEARYSLPLKSWVLPWFCEELRHQQATAPGKDSSLRRYVRGSPSGCFAVWVPSSACHSPFSLLPLLSLLTFPLSLHLSPVSFLTIILSSLSLLLSPLPFPLLASSLTTQVLISWYDYVLEKSSGLFRPKVQWEILQSGENERAWTVRRKPSTTASRNFPEPLVLTGHRNWFSQQGISNYFTDLLAWLTT